jgi:putative membrane protein
MMGYLFNGMGWWMGFGVILFILFCGGIVWLIVWAGAKGASERGGSDTARQSALDIAKTRYARGEITKEQFDQIKKDLS